MTTDDQSPDSAEMSILGQPVREPIAHLECFPAPADCTHVRLTSDEVTSLCPVTSQPDFSSIEIAYEPDALCIESKSLKLYLWSFRSRAVFAEQLAHEIPTEVARAATPVSAKVMVRQRQRGGVTIEATATV